MTVDRTFRVKVTHTAVTQKWLHLTLARPAGPDAQVRVRYRVPSSNPVQIQQVRARGRIQQQGRARYAGSGLLVFDATANEAPGATVDFKVMMLPAPVRRASVDYETSDDTADAGSDYTATSGTLIFEVGEIHKRISVPVIDDAVPDNGETFTLTLSNPINAFLGDATATGTIYNHDPEVLTASFGGAPEAHGGEPFVLLLQFTEPVGVGWGTMSDRLLSVTNGRVARARRVDRQRDSLSDKVLSALWEITIEPSGGDVTVELPATADCGASLAACTKDGRPLSAEAAVTIPQGVGLLAATVNAEALALTFEEALDAASVPAAAAFTVRAGGVERALATSGPVTVSGSTVTLTLASPVDHRETVTVDYTAPWVNPLRSLSGEAAAAIDGQSVTNLTPDTTAPELLSATATWDAVVLTWDEALDEASVPAAAAFTVRVGGVARGLAARDPVRVSGSTVTLKFGSPAAQGETVTVDYAAPSENPLRDLAGVAAAAAAVETVVPVAAFTVRFEEGSVPETHDGVNRVAFRIVFSEEPARLNGRWVSKVVRDAVVARIGGDRIHPRDVEKLDDASRRRWQMKVRFQGGFALATGDLTIELGPTLDCDDQNALCTGDRRPLSNRISKRVRYAPSLSVAGANATEAAGAAVTFPVTLSRAQAGRVTVDYATSDGTATAGDDYTAASGTLTFEPGETDKTVSVPVLDDGDNEEPETFLLTLTNASGAGTVIRVASATGTIEDDEPPAAEESGNPLTASFRDLPASHGGRVFTFELRFSEDVTDLSYATLRDHAFTVANGSVTRVRRLRQGKNQRWEITVAPDGDAEVAITLPATTDCRAAGAVCIGGKRPLSAAVAATVPDQASETGQQPADGLTAAFRDLPASHDGRTAFTLELRFSEDVTGLSYAALRDHAFAVTNGDVAGVRRLEPGKNRRWEVTVAPNGNAGVTITLPATTDCGASGAVCIGSRPLSSAATATVPGPALLTAEFRDVPARHDESAFTFELRFSENWTSGLSYAALRDHAFAVTNGDVAGVRRLEPGKNRRWEVTVAPEGNADVTVALRATTDCGALGAVCIGNRPLSAGVTATVPGSPGLSVADASVTEAADATVDFNVTMSRVASSNVTVDYATSDGAATAGSDYTSTSGTLTFAAGQTEKTVSVPVLDDALNEGEETFTLTLSNVSGGHAYLSDASATGTIRNSDPMPRGMLARFGRSAAAQVVEYVEERLEAHREPGFEGRFAGRELHGGTAGDVARDLASRFVRGFGGAAQGNAVNGSAGYSASGPSAAGTGAAGSVGAPGGEGSASAGTGGGVEILTSSIVDGDVLTGSSFTLNRELDRGGALSFWSRGARSSFSGHEEDLGLDGAVRTAMFGADYATGPMVAGLSVGRTWGLGDYSGEVADGRVTSSVTGVYPWLGYRLTDRTTVWGVAGYGAGGLLVSQKGASHLEGGLSMSMAAAGTRGELIAGARGFGLLYRADALWAWIASDAISGPSGNLAATHASVSRVRTALQGSHAMTLNGRISLRPGVTIGVRHDGGDAETGSGLDVAGGMVVSDPSTGLEVDVRVRMLLVHEAEGYRERGMALSVAYNPMPSTPLGWTLKVAPSWGGQAASGAEALWVSETTAGLASGGFVERGSRLDADLGYGMPLGSRFVGTPRLSFATSAHGRDYRVGYSVGALAGKGLTFRLGVDALRRERPMSDDAHNGVVARATLGW